MILFKLAKWMEERSRLDKSIKESRGDPRLLLHQIEQVDAVILTETRKWMAQEPEQTQDFLWEESSAGALQAEMEYGQVL
jgi:hypothetical protein